MRSLCRSELGWDKRSMMDSILETFEATYCQGGTPSIEDCILRHYELDRKSLLKELLRIELWWKEKRGLPCSKEAYFARFQDDRAQVESAFESIEQIAVSCNSGEVSELAPQKFLSASQCDLPTKNFSPGECDTATSDRFQGCSIQAIGRYQIQAMLGKGGFGTVFKARDCLLNRIVAIKVAHRAKGEANAALYLQEAQILAALDHPNIVPIYDYGSTKDVSCYLVSKLVAGSDLAELNKSTRTAEKRCKIYCWGFRKGFASIRTRRSNR